MIKPGDKVYVHGREATVKEENVHMRTSNFRWWYISISGTELLCPEDIMKKENRNDHSIS